MTTWELRYRAPRSVDDVQIETFTDDEAEARELADKWLQTLGSPAVRFVRLRRIVVAKSSDHPDLVGKYGGKLAKPKAAVAEDGGEGEVPSRSTSRAQTARVGA